jgi:hypothetical protein
MIGSRAVLAVVSVLSGCASYAHVDGGIHVEKDISWFHVWFWCEDTSRVVIGPGDDRARGGRHRRQILRRPPARVSAAVLL